MVAAGVMSDKDRLPWLSEYREPTSAKGRGKVATLSVLAVGTLAAAATLWLRPIGAPADLVPLPQSAPVEMADAGPSVTPVAETAPPIALALPSASRPITGSHPARRPMAAHRKIHSAGTDQDALDAVMAEQADPAAQPSAQLEGMATALAAIPGSAGDELLNPPSRPAVNPAAQVLRRQTVRLGVYLTPTQADIAWKSAIRSYTYLVTLPKQVQTVRLGGKGPRYYALNLGTPSRGHAKQLCRNLKAIGYACTVA